MPRELGRIEGWPLSWPRRGAGARAASARLPSTNAVRAVAVVALLVTLAVALIALLAPDFSERTQMIQWGQGLAGVAATAGCALAAMALSGRGRLVWGLFAVGQSFWMVTDTAFGVAILEGSSLPEGYLFDVGWLAFYAPMLVGVALLYGALRREPGWQGLLDGLALATAAGLLSWIFVLEPVAREGSDGTVGTVVNLLYPGFDLLGLLALGWLVVRLGRRSPDWLRWIAAAFGLQMAADLSYLAGDLERLAIGGALAAVLYMSGAWLWFFASVRAGRGVWPRTSDAEAPPLWSTAIPLALVCVLILQLARNVPAPIGALAVVSALLAAARLIATMRINRSLLVERGRAEAEQAALRRLATAVAEDSHRADDDGPVRVAAVAAREAASAFGARAGTVVRLDESGLTTVASWGQPAEAGLGPAESGPRVAVEVDGRAWGALVLEGGPPDAGGEVAERLAPFAELIALAVANAETRTARRALEEAKDEFISVASHELRTPLTSIRFGLEILAEGSAAEHPDEKRVLDLVVANTERLVRLINDLLDLQRLESGATRVQRARCLAGDLLLEAADTARAGAEEAGVSIVVESNDCWLWADADQIRQVLGNLIGNAVKFSPPGSTVSAAAERRAGEVVVQVRDEGRGIPADQLERIFERFVQVDATDVRDRGGTGLGLPICRSIVAQHGGRIWAESEPGGGSTFRFTVPLPSGLGVAPALGPLGGGERASLSAPR